MIRSPEYREAKATVKRLDAAQRKANKAESLKRAKVQIESILANRKRPRERDNGFLAYLRRQPCRVGPVGCSGPVQAAHLRYGDAKYNRVNPGMGRKPDDKWCSSLCAGHHAEQHATGNERAWWASHGLDGSEVAISQYAAYRGGAA